MLDIKFVRENPDVVDKACESRQNAHWDRERFFELDEERRSVIVEVEALQAERNAVSKQIGQLMREGKRDEAEAAKAKVTANKERIAELDEKRAEVEQALFDLVAAIPNIPHESVPYGKDDSDNPEVRRWGTPREFDTPTTPRCAAGAPRASLTSRPRRTGTSAPSWASLTSTEASRSPARASTCWAAWAPAWSARSSAS